MTNLLYMDAGEHYFSNQLLLLILTVGLTKRDSDKYTVFDLESSVGRRGGSKQSSLYEPVQKYYIMLSMPRSAQKELETSAEDKN
jgi:hypothetical protein